MTLHLMGKCYDKMIDGNPDEYSDLWTKLDMTGMYPDKKEFELGMIYDEENPCSLISAQKSAMDNAILLREDILSETLSYLEMSINLMRECRLKGERNITALQPVIDWSLAFWGSAEQRVQNYTALNLMIIGRNVENLDMKLRFGYSYRRVRLAFESLLRYCKETPDMVDEHIADKVKELLTADRFNLSDTEYKYEFIKFVNQLVRV